MLNDREAEILLVRIERAMQEAAAGLARLRELLEDRGLGPEDREIRDLARGFEPRKGSPTEELDDGV